MNDNRDQGSPDVATERGAHSETSSSERTALAIKAAIVLGVAVFAGFALLSLGAGKKPVAAPEKVAINKAPVFEPAPTPLPAFAPRPAPVMPLAPLPGLEAAKGPDMLDAARRAPVVAFAKPGRVVGTDTTPRLVGPTGDDKPEDGGTFEKLLKPTHLEGARAGVIGNRDFVIAMGTSIPCVLETALSSDEPGFVTCVVSRDVLSDNGHVVLLEKGTHVIGEYRGGLKRGQNRLFVLWTRAKTPTGVIVALGSPATDGLGRAGFDGAVDSHWWERFGSALLLSVVGDLSALGTQALADKNIQAQNTGSSGKQAATIAVEQGAAAVPTLRKHQGEIVSIMVGRDLDFGSVYKLRLVPPQDRQTTLSRPTAIGSGDVFSTKRITLKD